MISASQLGRIAACAGSEHLPHVHRDTPASKAGTAVHAFMEACNTKGMSTAIEEVPSEYRELCQLIGLESMPHGKGDFASEVAFAFDPDTLSAREIGRGIKRSYAAAGVRDTEVGGTADLVGVTESAVIVGDIKTGFGWQEADSWQLRALGMMAAIAYGKDEVHTFALLVRPGEEPFRITHRMDTFGIATAASDVAALVKRVKASDASHLAMGDHCRFCPAMPHCPAQVTLVKSLSMSAASPMTPADSAAALTPEAARIAWQRLKAAKVAIEHIEESVRLYAAHAGPLDIGGGKMLGLKEKNTESLDGGTTHLALKVAYGVEVADQAVEMKATKSALEKALKPVALASGKPLSELNRQALGILKQAGAIKSRTTESVVEYANKAAKE